MWWNLDSGYDKMRRKNGDIIRNSKSNRGTEKQEKYRAMLTPIHRDLAYVKGALFEDYIHDMKIIQRFAALNRRL